MSLTIHFGFRFSYTSLVRDRLRRLARVLDRLADHAHFRQQLWLTKRTNETYKAGLVEMVHQVRQNI